MNDIFDIIEDLEKQLPSEFLQKNISLFLIKWNDQTNSFDIYDSPLFREIKEIVLDFLKRYFADNKSLVLKRLGIKQFPQIENSFSVKFETFIPLTREIEKCLLLPLNIYAQDNADSQIKFIDLINAFVKGYRLCAHLNLSYSKNFLLMDLVFVKPEGFEAIYTKICEEKENKLLFITGEPRSGKTYSAFYFLNKFLNEKNHQVFHCSNLSRFEQLLADKNNYYRNYDVVIYYEDPFGYSSLNENDVSLILAKLGQSQEIEGLKVIVTSRKQLLLSGSYNNDILSKNIVINYQTENKNGVLPLPNNNPGFTTVYYNAEKIKLIILKIAWLYNAKWATEYSNFYFKTDTTYIWNRFNYSKFSPGSIYESFLISSALPTYGLQQIDKIEQSFLAGANDLMKAFESEVSTFVKRETFFYIKLFFVLPAITILDSTETIEKILGIHYSAALKYFDILKKQKDSPFTRESFTYYHPMLGEAVDRYLFKHGYKEFIDDPELGTFLENVNSLPEEFIRDFICFLYYLNFVQNISEYSQKSSSYSNDIPWLIRKTTDSIEDDRLKNEIKTIGFFYQTLSSNLPLTDKKKNVKLFLHRYVNDQNNLYSYIGSVLEHQLYFRLKNFKSENLSENVGVLIIAIAKTIKANTKTSGFLSSVFIHSIFSNLEYFVEYNQHRDKDDVFRNNKIISAIRGTVADIAEGPKIGTDPTASMNIAIIWLDAIMMKFSELHQYITQSENLIEKVNDSNGLISIQSKIDAEILRKDIYKCGLLKNELFGIYEAFWDTITKKAINKDYLRGAIAFSMAWHNRWNYGKGYDRFLIWIRKENLISPELKLWEESYRHGFLYNIKYHYDYFLKRNDSWTRESSIMIWKIDRPRKGANALYESGIIFWDLKKKNIKIQKSYELEAFGEIIKRIFKDGSFDDIVPVIFLVGLRYEKNQAYYELLVLDLIKRIKGSSDNTLTLQLPIARKSLTSCNVNLLIKRIWNE